MVVNSNSRVFPVLLVFVAFLVLCASTPVTSETRSSFDADVISPKNAIRGHWIGVEIYDDLDDPDPVPVKDKAAPFLEVGWAPPSAPQRSRIPQRAEPSSRPKLQREHLHHRGDLKPPHGQVSSASAILCPQTVSRLISLEVPPLSLPPPAIADQPVSLCAVPIQGGT